MKHWRLLILMLLWLCGCGDDPPEKQTAAVPEPVASQPAEVAERTRITQVGSVSFGKASVNYYRELRIVRERFITADDLLELHSTPLSNQVWRIDLVVPVMPGNEASDPVAELKKFIEKKFDLEFASASAVDLPDSRIEITRAFDRGPRGVRCTFIDRELETLFRNENSSPEAVTKRLTLRAGNDILRLEAAIQIYQRDTGEFPAQLSALVKDPGLDRWHGPYIDAIPLDPWGKNYFYRRSGNRFELFCTGADGKSQIR